MHPEAVVLQLSVERSLSSLALGHKATFTSYYRRIPASARGVT